MTHHFNIFGFDDCQMTLMLMLMMYPFCDCLFICKTGTVLYVSVLFLCYNVTELLISWQL